MKKTPIVIILNNIRSALNVGAIIRTADGVGASKVYLCGYTATPKHPKVGKTSLGAEDSVPWEYVGDFKTLQQNLKNEGYQIIGLEISDRSNVIWETEITFPAALLLGNEIHGISDADQKLCDKIVHLPMLGIKESLNVATATGIAAYELLRQYENSK